MIKFSLTASLPAPDVTGDVQTHLGAAHYTCWVLLCTYVLSLKWACRKVQLQAQNMHNMGPSVSGHDPFFYLKKRKVGQRGRQGKQEMEAKYCQQ
jgi:hypothetical protein